MISAEDGAPIDVAHMFRREQLSAETLLAIGAQGTLTADAPATPGGLWAALQQGDAQGLSLPSEGVFTLNAGPAAATPVSATPLGGPR